jgi:hypothetical protein
LNADRAPQLKAVVGRRSSLYERSKDFLFVMYAIFLSSLIASTTEHASSCMKGVTVNSSNFPRRGPFRIHGLPPKAFKSFLEFEFDFKDAYDKFSKDPSVAVSIGGVLRAKPNLEQSTAKLTQYSEIDVEGNVKMFDVIEHQFASAKLSRAGFLDRIVFNTETVAGISYGFQGKLVDTLQFDRQYTSLEGTLTKYRNGQKVTEAKVDLIEWTFE